MAEKVHTLLIVVNTDSFFLSHRLPLALVAREQGWMAARDISAVASWPARGLLPVPLPWTATPHLNDQLVAEALCLDHRSGRVDHQAALWPFLVPESWVAQNRDSPVSVAPSVALAAPHLSDARR